MIPQHLLADRYWRGALYIFTECEKLQRYVGTYIDFEEYTIDSVGLKRISKPWSESEKFMLNLALHLFNEKNNVNLSGMDYLDSNNKAIALKAIQLRFAG
ncbi:hypothetical protein OIN60_01390 [Paenibacillus sp. P96]|uniref:Uncharacterized protein n=1 Tax=Paenibacillus zeirhizosphaerae TaxID=2987519 RepID=A0ABT9FL46_9BACL|nr:hypothetical protein [Paenibacillus sp. P96]MDP4095445.1 hypothetical protein [Paenibacillus sp. P96]